jgi:hypothetical protein
MGIGQGGDGVVGNTGLRPSLSIQAQKHRDLFCASGSDKSSTGSSLVSPVRGRWSGQQAASSREGVAISVGP